MSDPVHVWLVDVDAAASLEREALPLLSAAELERADSFHFAVHRTRFVLTHAALRVLLGRACQLAPAQIEFAANAAGRPEVKGADVAFNLSHSDALAAIAICPQPVLGIDIERCELPRDAGDVARAFFAPAECADLNALAGAGYERAFFRCWTRKEAVLKAVGDGISERALRELVVSLDEAPRVIRWNETDPGAWQLWPLDLPAGYEGAVAVRGLVSGPVVRWCTVQELLRPAPGPDAGPGAEPLST